MILKSIFQALWSSKPILLHTVVILSLTCVSIWDAIMIIDTFVNDNRITVVQTETRTNSLPYLENISIVIISPSSVLPNSWLQEANITNLRESMYYEKIRNDTLEGKLDLRSIDISTVEGKLYAVSLFSLLSEMDRDFGSICVLLGRSSCPYDSSVHRNYGSVLGNASELENLQEELFSEYYRAFIEYPAPENTSVVIHLLKHNQLNFEVKFDPDEFRASNFRQVVRVRLPDDLTPTSANETHDSTVVHIFSGRSNTEWFRLKPRSNYRIGQDVRNLGLYDKSKTEECTRDIDVMPIMRQHPNCDNRGYLKSIVAQCGCVPFSARKHLRKLKDQWFTTAGLPFCDFEHYYRCSSVIDGPIEIEESQCLPSCITIRNQYTLSSTRDFQCETFEDPQCSTVDFNFSSTDHSYVMFEDRFQLSNAQFVSQLGGDIGLYTGLSLLSVWQLIVFVHNRYEKDKNSRYRKNSKEEKRRKPFKDFLIDLFKEIETSMVQFDGEKQNEGCEMKGQQTEMELERKILLAVDQRMRQLAKEMEADEQRRADRMVNQLVAKIEERTEIRMDAKFSEVMTMIRSVAGKEMSM